MTALYDGQEIERQRVSRELHDGLGQMLVAMKIKFENSVNMDQPVRMETLLSLREDFTRIIEEVRKVSYDLSPAGFKEFGLDQAMKLLCSELSRHGGIEIEYAAFGKFEKVTLKQRNYLFRIAQEGLNNAIRHSNAGKIHVQLTETSGNLILMLEDNGSGFVPGTRPGNGLYNMKERARLLGGTFDLETTPGEGTTIRVKIPEENGTTI
jgi:signal transduction histidine kinase